MVGGKEMEGKGMRGIIQYEVFPLLFISSESASLISGAAYCSVRLLVYI